MSVRRQRLVVLGIETIMVASIVTLVAFAVSPVLRPIAIPVGALGGLVLLFYICTNSPRELTGALTLVGMAIAAAAVGANVVLLAGAGVLLLCFGELSALHSTLGRVDPDATIDARGRATEVGALVAVAALAALVAALGAIVHLPSHIVAVMFGALTLAAIGKLISTRLP